jgi:hypothetical protein
MWHFYRRLSTSTENPFRRHRPLYYQRIGNRRAPEKTSRFDTYSLAGLTQKDCEREAQNIYRANRPRPFNSPFPISFLAHGRARASRHSLCGCVRSDFEICTRQYILGLSLLSGDSEG